MKLSIFCYIINKKSNQICIKVQKTSGNNFHKQKKRKATWIYFDPPSISQETTRTLKSPYQTQENSRQLLGTPASQNLVSHIFINNQFVLCLPLLNSFIAYAGLLVYGFKLKKTLYFNAQLFIDCMSTMYYIS